MRAVRFRRGVNRVKLLDMFQADRCLDSYPIIRIRAFGRSIPICISIPLRRQERMQYMMFITVLIMTGRTPSVLPLAQRISGNG